MVIERQRMFCPRCGNQINEGLKFCKSCGLPVAQVSTYVATGGTGQLMSPPPMMAPPQMPEYLTPKQQMAAIILIWAFAIPLIALFCAMFDLPEELIALPAITFPLGIIGAFFRYRAQVRRRQYEEQYAQYYQQQYYQQQQPQQQNWAPPAVNAPTYQSALTPPRTNPLGKGSVIEDETKKLPEKRR
jgi:hypothetical protein